MNKKAQVTLFVIFSILIVTGIIALFLLRGNIETSSLIEINPTKEIQDCARESVQNQLQKVLQNGGRDTPRDYINYSGEKYNYLCYQADFYQGCYNTHPMLEYITESEIRFNTLESIQNCFNNVRQDLEEKGYSVGGGSTNYSIDILLNKIRVTLEKKISISKGNSLQEFQDFSFEILSSASELIGFAREIVNTESQYCTSEYNGLMLLYPSIEIKKINYDNSKIYFLKNRKTQEQFKFAVRGCVFPPGI
jgi:hypothetical protein